MKKIVFCLPGNHYSGLSLDCWTRLVLYCSNPSNGIEMHWRRKWYPGNCYYVRNMCLDGNTVNGAEQSVLKGIDYDHIMWIDSDIQYTVDDVLQLLSRDTDIVSGPYKTSNQKTYTAGLDWDTKHFEENGHMRSVEVKDITGRDLIEATWMGFGFLLMKKGVMETLPYPWFRPEWPIMAPGIEEFASEDVSFAVNIRRAGYRMYLDPMVAVKHEKSIVI